MTFEILLKNDNKIKLARVLLRYDILKWKFPKNGVWSYLIDTNDGIVVFDTGPFYNTLFGNKGKLTKNAEIIFDAIKNNFENKPIKEIWLSHYHHDHSQNAGRVQQINKEMHGITAPIRIHEKDLTSKKLLKIFDTSLAKILGRTGFENAVIGNPLKEGEKISDTDFEVLYSPGHTHGSVSLVNHTEKILITGWWVGEKPNFVTNWAMRLINEDVENIEDTKKKLSFDGYKVFYLHKLG